MKKRLSVLWMTIMMVFSLLPPVPIQAAEPKAAPEFDADSYYALVDSTSGKAVKMRTAAYMIPADADNVPHVEGEVQGGKVDADGMSAFKIQKKDDYYGFYCEAANSNYLEFETGAAAVFSYSSKTEEKPDPRDVAQFALEETTDGYKIKSKAVADTYLKVNQETKVIGSTTNKDEATVFKIQPVSIRDESISIENKETGKYVSFKDLKNQDTPQPIKVNVEKNALTDDEKFNPAFLTNNNHSIDGIKEGTVIPTVGFTSKSKPEMVIISADYGSENVDAIKAKKANPGGWESVVVWPNGDGTVSIRSSYSHRYATVNANDELTFCDTTEPTDKEKFIIHSDMEPNEVTELKFDSDEITSTSLNLQWKAPKDCIYTGLELLEKDVDGNFTKVADVSNKTSYTVENLNSGTEHTFKIRTVNGNGKTDATVLTADSTEVTAKTLTGVKPGIPTDVACKKSDDNKIKISWGKSANATGYVIQRAESRFSKYEDVATVGDVDFYEYTYKGKKYENYFRVIALNNDVRSKSSNFTSLETETFGKNVLIFSEKDDIDSVNKLIRDIYDEQSDFGKDAQFNTKRYAIYFKPGDYKRLKPIPVGFYTQLSGLGDTPDDVTVNNITVPAYLGDRNATCNFWRSAENLTVGKDGTSTGDDIFGSWRADYFNWAVAQAAPIRRINSERPVAYDWNFGWASGGYTADSKISGYVDDDGNKISAGTFSGQQFYTRNTDIAENVYGCTLNAFFQGTTAKNLPTDEKLLGGNGHSNWGIGDEDDNQQIVTNIETTPEIREKPFLFFDEKADEYKVFVPSIRKDAKGTSWTKEDMGKGEVLSLSDFYIAKEGDKASKINAELNNDKNVFFTPGVYHAEETINVDRENTVVLGTGMASIIPENKDAAMKVADKDGITVAGLIFDAGTKNSKYLLQVGEKGASKDHKDKPTLLADLFFRIGGTTKAATSAENALEINSNNVIGDHFWIWRADHGAGVSWDGNAAQNGLIVNGDDVTCYALFNEHFEDYTTLWNGENGKTYFYQNETAYDAISQDPSHEKAWLSHHGTTKGYASYKVSNNVNKHYAVGLGIYNVFIYTGGGEFNQDRYDGGVQIELDNAIEVPNKENVLIENACLQTFAKSGEEGGLYQSTNSIVNGVGAGVSSGYLREETRAEDGSLNGRLLDKDGNPIKTKIYKKESKNEFDAKIFEYIVREVDKNGNEIFLDADGNEYALEKFASYGRGYKYKVNKTTGEFKIYNDEGKELTGDELKDAKLPTREIPLSRAVKGNGWARTFLTSYRNGTAVYGKAPTGKLQFGKVVELVTETNVKQPGDENLNLNDLEKTYNDNKGKKEAEYTAATWKNFAEALENARVELQENGYKYGLQSNVDKASEVLKAASAALVKNPIQPGEPTQPNVEKSVSALSVSKLKNKTYTGKQIKQYPTVKDGSKVLKNGTDYTLSFGKNKAMGKASVVITGKGNYTGSKTLYFYIVPKKVSLKSAKKKSKSKITVKYKKIKGVSGYQIAYQKKGSKKWSYKYTKKTTYTLSKLKNKKYNVKVRAYKTVSGKKYFGSYSKKKVVKLR